MPTTTKLGDWLGRRLSNHTPGTSAATDYMGRNIIAGDKDFNGQALATAANYPPADWAASTAVALGVIRRLPGTKEVQTLTSTGSPTGNLKVNGQTIAMASIDAAHILTALTASGIAAGDVAVTGSGPYTLTFAEALGNVGQVVVDNSGLSGGTFAAATTTQGALAGQILQVSTAGTTDTTKPAAPGQIGGTVTDGTAVWKRLK